MERSFVLAHLIASPGARYQGRVVPQLSVAPAVDEPAKPARPLDPPVTATQSRISPLPAPAPENVFVWPKNVDEFLDLDPKYLDRWLVSRRCPADLIEDFRQELLLHLLTPNAECIANGWPDKMMLYKPERIGGTTKRAWAFWLSRYLLNSAYNKLINDRHRATTQGKSVVSLGGGSEVDGVVEGWLMLQEHEQATLSAEEGEVFMGVTSSLALEGVIALVEEEMGQDAVEVLQAVGEADTFTEAARILHLSPTAVRKRLKDIRALISSVTSPHHHAAPHVAA